MKRSELLLLCSVIYAAPHVDATWALAGFFGCFVGWLYYVSKGE